MISKYPFQPQTFCYSVKWDLIHCSQMWINNVCFVYLLAVKFLWTAGTRFSTCMQRTPTAKEPWIHSMVDTLCGNLPCLQPWIKNGGQHFEHGSGVLGGIYNDLRYWHKANLQEKKRGIPSVQWTANVDTLICNACYRCCLYMHIQTDKFSSGWRCLEGTFTVRSAWPENVACGGS